MISPCKASANDKDNSVFPTAVGPVMTTTFGLWSMVLTLSEAILPDLSKLLVAAQIAYNGAKKSHNYADIINGNLSSFVPSGRCLFLTLAQRLREHRRN